VLPSSPGSDTGSHQPTASLKQIEIPLPSPKSSPSATLLNSHYHKRPAKMPTLNSAEVTQQKYSSLMEGQFEKHLAGKANTPKLRSQKGTLLEGLDD